MTLEARLHDYVVSQAEAVPPLPDALGRVTARGRRRVMWRRTGMALASVAVVVLATATVVVFASGPAPVVASPLTGQELALIHENPPVLRGELGPEPETPPEGVDLTFAPIDAPTGDDLAAIDQLIEDEGYTSPTVVALGEITAAQTHVYVLHDLDPDTHAGRSTVVAIGPDYPEYQARSGPTAGGIWQTSSSRDRDGHGWVAMRASDVVSYVEVDAAGSFSWQRPSDGFIWIPFDAPLDETVTVTGYDASSRAVLRQSIDRSVMKLEMIETTQALISRFKAEIDRISTAMDNGTANEEDEAHLIDLRNALEDAEARLAALEGDS